MLTVTLRTLLDSTGRTRVVMTRRPADPLDPRVIGIHDCPHAAVREILSIMRRIRQALPEALHSVHCITTEKRGRLYCRLRAVLDLLPGQTISV